MEEFIYSLSSQVIYVRARMKYAGWSFEVFKTVITLKIDAKLLQCYGQIKVSYVYLFISFYA